MSKLSELAEPTYKDLKDDGVFPIDASVWIQRLIDRNADSPRPEKTKKLIDKHLKNCLLDLDIPF